MDTVQMLQIEMTKKGYPAAWEQGGGYTNTGEATIICDSKGEPKKSIYIRRSGHLACEQHALIPLQKGDYILQFSHHRADFDISILEVLGFMSEKKIEIIDTDMIFPNSFKERFEKDPKDFPLWGDNIKRIPNTDLGYINYEDYIIIGKRNVKTIQYAVVEEIEKFPVFLEKAIEAGKQKSLHYHCREPYYIKDGVENE